MTNDLTSVDVVVRDGSTVCVRRTHGGDIEALLQFFKALSLQSLFLCLPPLMMAGVRKLATLGGIDGTSLVVESGGRIVAFAGFYRDPDAPDRAEVAFAVAEALQGHGIGTRLLERLADAAREQGIDSFEAYVLSENHRMLDVFRDSGFVATTEGGVCHVVLSLSATGMLADKAAARSRQAATASMKTFFEPRGVAIVGANRERGKVGSEILHNVLAGGPGEPREARSASN